MATIAVLDDNGRVISPAKIDQRGAIVDLEYGTYSFC